MTKSSEVSNHNWRTASKLSFFRWPATVALAGATVSLLNLIGSGNRGLSIGAIHLRLSDALFIFSCVLLATLPIWYFITNRLVCGEPKPPVTKQISACLGLLILALLVVPRIEIEYRDYDTWSETDRRDITTTFVKRSIVETVLMPQLALDELAWLQSNYSAAYIPAQVFCPRRSTRLYPFFGIERSDYIANALAPDIGEATGSRPPAAALANGITRCNREGPAMLAAGNTKESALLQGDIDRFFALNALEESPNKSIVLEDAQIPAPIMAKIETVLEEQSDDLLGYVDDPNFGTTPGQARRLTPLVLAKALGRSDDIARLLRNE